MGLTGTPHFQNVGGERRHAFQKWSPKIKTDGEHRSTSRALLEDFYIEVDSEILTERSASQRAGCMSFSILSLFSVCPRILYCKALDLFPRSNGRGYSYARVEMHILCRE